MHFYSKNFLDNFNFLNIFNVSNKIRKIYISSAYCDTDTIYTIKRHILNNIDLRGCEFKVFIDKYANHALPSQDLSRRWKILSTILSHEISSHSGIYLVDNNGKLFHSKLLYIETTQSKKICIGSMNYTVKGTMLDSNEEILLEIDSNKNTQSIIHECYQYFKILIENSTNINDIDKNEIVYRSLYDFFSSGSLCFEYAKSNYFTFKLGIPNSLKRNKSRIEGLFDITEDTINIIDILYPHVKENNKLRYYWKQYTIETPYGFFTPVEFKNLIDKKINCKSAMNDSLVNDIISSVGGKITIDNLILPYLKKINSQCNEILKERLEEEWDYDKLVDKWDKWYARLQERFNEDEIDEMSMLILRYIHSIDISPMPDIFNDKFTYDDFLNNFITSINFKIEMSDYRRSNKFITFLIEFMERYNYEINDPGDLKKCITNDNFREELLAFARKMEEPD